MYQSVKPPAILHSITVGYEIDRRITHSFVLLVWKCPSAGGPQQERVPYAGLVDRDTIKTVFRDVLPAHQSEVPSRRTGHVPREVLVVFVLGCVLRPVGVGGKYPGVRRDSSRGVRGIAGM